MDSENTEGGKNKNAELGEDKSKEEKRHGFSFKVKKRLEIKEAGTGTEKAVKLVVIVEELRFIVYLIFLTTFLLGIELTTLFSQYFIPFDYNKIMEDTFGYPNFCVFFDHPPATYILPSFYAFGLFFTYNYVLASIFRAWIAKQEGKISGIAFKLLTAVFIYFGISKLLFCTCFAVSPDQSMPSSIIVHTLPFTNLSVGLSVLQLAVTWFGVHVAWVDLAAPKWLRIASYVTMIGIIPVTILKIINQLNAFGDLGVEHGISHGQGLLWNVTITGDFFRVIDVLWFVFAFVFPMIQSGYLTFRRFDTHAIIFYMGDNRNSRIN